MIEAIVFDFDGVLVESLDIKTRAFARLFEAEGESIVRSVVEYHLVNGGVSRYDKFRYYYRELLDRELTDSRFQELCLDFSKLVLDEVVKCPYVPGAYEFLNSTEYSVPYYVASATPENELTEILEHRGMKHFFKRYFGTPTTKTEAVAKILNEDDLLPDEVAFIGDALADYEAAMANKVHFIARCVNGTGVFDAINCIKIRDLSCLQQVLETL